MDYMADEQAGVKTAEYCCNMRARFVVSIVAINQAVPEPVDVIDFLDYENKSPNGHPVIYLAHCAFCGAKLPRERRRMIDLDKDDNSGDEWKAGTVD